MPCECSEYDQTNNVHITNNIMQISDVNNVDDIGHDIVVSRSGIGTAIDDSEKLAAQKVVNAQDYCFCDTAC